MTGFPFDAASLFLALGFLSFAGALSHGAFSLRFSSFDLGFFESACALLLFSLASFLEALFLAKNSVMPVMAAVTGVAGAPGAQAATPVLFAIQQLLLLASFPLFLGAFKKATGGFFQFSSSVLIPLAGAGGVCVSVFVFQSPFSACLMTALAFLGCVFESLTSLETSSSEQTSGQLFIGAFLSFFFMGAAGFSLLAFASFSLWETDPFSFFRFAYFPDEQILFQIMAAGSLALFSLGIAFGFLFYGAQALHFELQELSQKDRLTGLYARRAFFEIAYAQGSRDERLKSPLSVLFVDIDALAKINASHGNLAGDKVIARAAQVLKQNSRASDVLSRFSSEEFCLLLGETPLQGAFLAGERILSGCLAASASIGIPFSVSAGAATRLENETLESLIGRAAAACQAAKRKGHGRIEAEDGKIRPEPVLPPAAALPLS